MRIDTHSRAFRSFVVTGATALLLTTGLAASTASPTYTGQLTFGAPTVTKACAHGVPTQVKISVPFNASLLTAPVSRQVRAQFIYQGTTLGYLEAAGPLTVTIRPGERSPLVERFTVPTDRPYNEISIGLAAGGLPESWEQAALSCTTSPPRFLAPSVSSVSHPCLASTTARVVNSSTRRWSLHPHIAGRTTPTTTIAPQSSASITIGSALQGAERFTVSSNASAGTTSVTVALIDFNEACLRGYVRASLSAVRAGSLVLLAATERPVLPQGTPVDFYRVVNGKRVFVGRSHTGPTGRATLAVSPYQSHASFVGVIGATHYSYATATPTATVP